MRERRWILTDETLARRIAGLPGRALGSRRTLYDQRPATGARLLRAALRHVKRTAQAVVRLAVGGAGTLARAGQRAVVADRRVRRILVIRMDLIGDVVLSLPAVRALRQAYPDAAIDFLAQPSSAAILAGQPDIAHVLTYDAGIWRNPAAILRRANRQAARAIFRRLRQPRYDLCVSISGDWASILAWLSGARRRVGYAREAYRGMLTDPVPGGRYAIRRHEVEYVRELARAAGGREAENTLPELTVLPAAVATVATLLAEADLDEPRGPLVALHAGARNGLAKRWPTALWAELAARLARDLGARVALVGAPGDGEIAGEIAHAAGAGVVDLTGRTSLPELAALLARCDLLVSGDSGPLHIACAVGTPVAGLYGPTDPAISGPLGQRAVVLRQALWCAPCYDASAVADCRFGNPVCMKTLPPAAVLAAARRLLAEGRGGAVRAAARSKERDARREPTERAD
ncbi:MAG TPA: lipopolysaccharide heptosyltransferase II [Ktedonobacterales bacterium]